MRYLCYAAIFSTLLLAGCGGSGGSSPAPSSITIGAMLEQTGTLTDFTPEYTAACQLAVQDENARLAGSGSHLTVALDIQDSQSTPAGASTAMAALVRDHVSYTLGPRTSGQCKQILPAAQSNKVAVLASRSVADDLALPNDALFRLIAPDSEVIPLVARTAVARGLKQICVFYRNDVFGKDALKIMTQQMAAAGGAVVYSQIYDAATGPTDADLQTFATNAMAQAAIHGTSTGIAYFSLTEMVNGFAKLNAQPDAFRTIGSMSSQSLANIQAFISNPAALAYCESSGFQAVAFALASQAAATLPAGAALLNRIAAKSGKANPDELSINVYDGMRAMMVAAEKKSGSDAIAKLNAELASTPAGTLAPMKFDANGDRIGSFYGVYQIDPVSTTWVRSGTLTP